MVKTNSFSLNQREQISNYVENLLENIVDQITKILTPIGIVLYGSFGRGEGTVYCENSEIKLISDLEIGVISNNIFKRPAIRQVNEKMIADGIDVSLSFFLPKRFNSRVPTNWAFPSASLTLEQYDLILGHHVLYGTVPRNTITDLSSTDIMSWDALRLIFNRIAEVLELKKYASNKLIIAKRVSKLLIACGDAVLILKGTYHHSYSKRLQKLTKFANLWASSSCYLNTVKWEHILSAYKWKLDTSSHLTSIPSIKGSYYQCLLPVLQYCVSELFGWSFQNPFEFKEKYLLEQKLKHCSRTFPGFPIFQNLLINMRIRERNHIYSWRDPHRIYADLLIELEMGLFGRGEYSCKARSDIFQESRKQHRIELVQKWETLCSIL